jgi:hypothetical protein
LIGHETAEASSKSIREEVGEPVERGIVVVGGLSAGARCGAQRAWRVGSQRRAYVPWRRRSVNGVFDRAAHISLV